MKVKTINRRKFFADTALSAAGLMLGSNFIGCSTKGETSALPLSDSSASDYNIMEEVMKFPKIDSHAHVYFSEDSPEYQIDFADRLGIDKLVISRPMKPGSEGTPEEFRACNDLILECVKKYPDRFIGQMTLNPTYKKESLEEIRRCTDQGMVGLKVYNHVKISDPLFYPIIEKFIDLNMIILMHVGIGKSRITYDPGEPENVSIPADFVEVSRRYPEAMFQFAHLAGGEDWEDAVKALKHASNVYVDVSGSNNDAFIIDFAIKYLGEDRILFGCDNSFYQGVGHMLSANLSEAQRRKIFFENYNNILKKSGNHVG
ncbi:putative TIM-barrel fold metal-dependent hydrolase [Catalinimonas alkaloidigena]|uniref:amidohydrolase family protein n=1 Tax=Catalinimonas alkaloidigena TaxID=1075417 RepID=UPI0024054DD2|nr:amidohydrolase family protein [Catalinimonas alkaloidigena]MDF9798901.1 putative TIM-barrel fold metal-dependent hydrolase [Catalinimonas alkaloidigena]